MLFRSSVSEATARILNFLIDRGMLITYATARSGHSAAKLVGDIDFRLPAIIRNGTVFADPKTGRETEIIMFAPKEAQAIGRCMEGLKLCGFVTTYLAGVEKKLYLEGRVNKSFGHYLEEHSTDRRLLPVNTGSKNVPERVYSPSVWLPHPSMSHWSASFSHR